MKKVVSKKEIVLVLEDIRSTHNVGAIFRTADACGVSKIYLVGVTPSPIDRFGRVRNDIAKSALGAENTLPWEAKTNTQTLLNNLRKKGFYVVSLEQSENSVDYKKKISSEKICLVVGNEVGGVSKKTLEKSDAIIEIPMVGKKESLNVSVATGVALFRIVGI